MFSTSRPARPISISQPRRGFTLTEMLVVLAIVGILAAILFPVFGRAKENARRGHCAGNLQNIYLATRQYREDFQGFPPSLETLLPPGSVIVTSLGDHTRNWADPAHKPSFDDTANPPLGPLTDTGISAGDSLQPDSLNGIVSSSHRVASINYLKSLNEVLCPSDTVELNGFSSSYGERISSSWNFYGFDRLGFQMHDVPRPALLVNPNRPADIRTNPVKNSLANRFAPPGTIVTHCIYHRMASSNLRNPYALSTPDDGGKGQGASDIVLRLDGSAKWVDVSKFLGTKSDASDNRWQFQTSE